jgi:hypothetical protein
MSVPFNDETNLSGLIQLCEKWTNLGKAGISGSTDLLNEFTAGINAAYDELLPLIYASDAKWQWDDPNHAKDPMATTALVSGQAKYAFVSDEQGNSILEVRKVFVVSPEGVYRELEAVDAQTDKGAASILAQPPTQTGTPTRYDKLGSTVILDPIPDYSATYGIKALFSRTPSYFASTDTTKTPGIPVGQELLALIPSRDYVAIHKSDNVRLLQVINDKIAEQKAGLTSFLSKRAKDERTVMRPRVESSR